MLTHMGKWFDHHLKGIDNGVDRDPAVRYYVMGAVGEPGCAGQRMAIRQRLADSFATDAVLPCTPMAS